MVCTSLTLKRPITIGRFAFAPQQWAEAFNDHIQATPDDYSPFEAKRIIDENHDALKADFAQAMQSIQADEDFSANADAVKQTIQQELMATGRHSDKTSEANATALASYFATRAHMLGETPQALYQRTGLRIATEGGYTVGGESGYTQAAYHGTPHRGIEQTGFKLNKIGTGEGAQAYGHGIYFAQAKDVAESYRGKLTEIRYQGKPLPKKEYVVGNGVSTKDFAIMTLGRGLQNGKPYAGFGGQLIQGISFDEAKRQAQQEIEAAISYNIGGKQFLKDMKSALRELEKLQESDFQSGQLYGADIPESHELLDFEAPLSKQPKQVREALKRVLADERVAQEIADYKANMKHDPFGNEQTGKDIYGALADFAGGAKEASEILRDAGIPGLRYLDGNSRTDGEGTHNFVIWDEARLTPEAAKIETYYQRNAATKAAYEARIDALFAGEKPNNSRSGVRVLDSSDMLGLLGMGTGPVHLAESKVNAAKHPNMTADVWKKIPQWLDNPAAVFDSDTVNGRLVLVAPETIGGKPLLMIVEPNGVKQSDGVQVHLLQNAYDKDESLPPFGRWLRDGKGRYVNQKEFPTVLQQSGLQLSSSAWQNKPGTGKILNEKNLAGYKKERTNRLNQNPDAPRGLFDAQNFTIALLSGSDLSTTLHEGAHFFFENDLALAGEIVAEAQAFGYDGLSAGQKQLLADTSTLLSWHGLQGDTAEQLMHWNALEPEAIFRHNFQENQRKNCPASSLFRSKKSPKHRCLGLAAAAHLRNW